jgi:uncharacterized cupin superfamily protein
MARFGPALGATQMGASLYELPPGQSICPYRTSLSRTRE